MSADHAVSENREELFLATGGYVLVMKGRLVSRNRFQFRL